MTMLDILKDRLPDGLEIVKIKDRAGRSQIEIVFSYARTETIGWLYKTCVPGKESNVCDFTIYAAMTAIALKKGDMEMAKHWAQKEHERAAANST